MPSPSTAPARKGLLSALFGRRPAAKPISTMGELLVALGARPMTTDVLSRSTEPTVRAHVKPQAGEDAGLLAIAFSASISAADVRLQLRSRDGSVLDEVVGGPGEIEAVLFMPPGPAVLVARTAEGRKADAVLTGEAIWAFPPEALTPGRLAVVGDLNKPFDWSEAYLPPKPADAGGRLRARLFRDMTAAHAIPTVGGKQVLLEPGDELSRAVFITGFYEPESMAAISQILPKGGVFVDVGAHCGMFTLLAADKVGPEGKVVAFEPSKREYDRLIANVELNGLRNVITSTAAVAEVAGEVRLLIAEAGHAGHNTTSKRFAYPAVRLAEAVDVPAVTLDAFFLQHGLDRCDVIKMDIEGGELPALKGAVGILQKHRPTLVLETFEKAMAANETTTGALTGWLAEQGYQFRDIDPRTGRISKAWTDQPDVSKNVVAIPKR